MTEPLYNYVRGKGWVYETHTRHLVKGRDGVEYYVVERKPEQGEKYLCQTSLEECFRAARTLSYKDYFGYTRHSFDSRFIYCAVEEA